MLQTYVWQDYDLCPKFPVLNRFLGFWLEKLEGPLHSVTVAHSRLIKPAEIRARERRIPAALTRTLVAHVLEAGIPGALVLVERIERRRRI